MLLLLPWGSASAKGEASLWLGGKHYSADVAAAAEKIPGSNTDRDGTALGVMASFTREGWPVHLAVDYLVGGDVAENDSGVSGEGFFTRELHLGVRKYWARGSSKLHPFAGGGLAWVYGNGFTVNPLVAAEQSDSQAGMWAQAGLAWHLGKRLNLGLDARYSRAELTFPGNTKVEAGGALFGAFTGFRW